LSFSNRFRLGQLVTFICVLSFATDRAAAQELPDAPGKDMVVKLCSGCHEPTVVLTADLSVNGWPGEIQKMIGLGAQGTDAQFREVLNYLAANVSTPVSLVNVNSASEAELELALQISRKDAIAIVDYRAKNGKFKSVDDLKRVPGVDTKKIEANKSRVSF
jgi:competence protein ComEA